MANLKTALLTLSDPASPAAVNPFLAKLERLGIQSDVSDLLFVQTTPKQRAEVFNACMRSNAYDYIFDVSGGDLASLTLPYLDYEAYQNSKTFFCGYSDLTCVLNALAGKTGKPAILFQPCFHRPFEEVVQWLQGKDAASLFTFQVDPLIPGTLSGKVAGGNIRCLLKSAGTPYFPQLENKVLFLESHSGGVHRIEAFLGQLMQMGVFESIEGILFGQFTQLDDAYGMETSTKILESLLKDLDPEWSLPVWRTTQIGHSADSKAIWIGKNLKIQCDESETDDEEN